VVNGVLEEYYSSVWASGIPKFSIPKKNETIRIVVSYRKLNLLLKHSMTPNSNSKDWGHIPFNGRVYLCLSIRLRCGLSSHKLDSGSKKLYKIVFPWHMVKCKYRLLTMTNRSNSLKTI
jgi:hypothetical protein